VDPFAYAHSRKDVVWMSQNTNTIPIHPAIREAILEAVESQEYSLYPYAKGIEGLPGAILDDLGLPEHRALLTNGGIEGLYITSRALLREDDEVIATDPSFLPIHHQVSLSGAKTVELPIYQEPWKMEVDAVQEAVTDSTRILLLIDPLNPLGTSYTREEVRALCEVAEDRDLYVIDDITYRDFAEEHTLATEFLPERTVIAYSFSKNCGLAGMRIGALVSPPDLMETMLPYNTNVLSVNVLAQRAALTALETKGEWFPRVLAICHRNQERIRLAVEAIDGAFLPVYPSRTNMFVIDVSELGLDPAKVEESLLYDHGVFVRGGGYVSKQFGNRFIRVSFSVPEDQCQRFAMALPEVLQAGS
jgi:aspartate/methionine/tyrosine aminotransferase